MLIFLPLAQGCALAHRQDSGSDANKHEALGMFLSPHRRLPSLFPLGGHSKNALPSRHLPRAAEPSALRDPSLSLQGCSLSNVLPWVSEGLLS